MKKYRVLTSLCDPAGKQSESVFEADEHVCHTNRIEFTKDNKCVFAVSMTHFVRFEVLPSK
jgi:hypothetical protein